MATVHAPRSLADRIAAPFARFLAIEAASAILLLAAAVVALAWANSPWSASYHAFWHQELRIGIGGAELALTLEHWVNDGLMALFFFLVGMEIKHELAHGELSTRERAMLPAFGALGGMIVPATIYATLHAGGPAASGWGVPMATDIAFAVAALAALGPRVPPGLKVFLLALAIVDDLGAVAVIAIFYTGSVSGTALLAALLGLGVVVALQRAGVRSYPVYWLVGIAVWLATLESGVHATVAGVALGFLTPTEAPASRESLAGRVRGFANRLIELADSGRIAKERGRVAIELQAIRRDALSPLEALTRAIHPWSAFFVMPVFALANAGVPIEGRALTDPLAFRVALGVALGLLVGKPVGIVLVSGIAVRLGLAQLPAGVTWGALAGAGILAGIGFTMALFLTALAFTDPALAAASKAGVMAASVVAAVAGVVALRRVLPRA